VESSHQTLDSIDTDIYFTVEHEYNGQLPFLDTLTIRRNSVIHVTVYRKPTHADRYLDYNSHATRCTAQNKHSENIGTLIEHAPFLQPKPLTRIFQKYNIKYHLEPYNSIFPPRSMEQPPEKEINGIYQTMIQNTYQNNILFF
jgi:hypothetical protein